MAEVYDFVKYQSEKEIEMYVSSIADDEYACYGCPECDNHTFIVLITSEVLCAECNTTLGGDE
jgi:ribosomal protein L37AE/L43A